MTESNESPANHWSISQSAVLLGISEFTLFSRIQTNDIAAVRASWGEIIIPRDEIERLLGETLKSRPADDEISIPSDSALGIERRQGGLKRNGEPAEFRIPYAAKAFTKSETQAYRTAMSAIADELNSIVDTRKQLEAASSQRNTEAKRFGE